MFDKRLEDEFQKQKKFALYVNNKWIDRLYRRDFAEFKK